MGTEQSMARQVIETVPNEQYSKFSPLFDESDNWVKFIILS